MLNFCLARLLHILHSPTLSTSVHAITRLVQFHSGNHPLKQNRTGLYYG